MAPHKRTNKNNYVKLTKSEMRPGLMDSFKPYLIVFIASFCGMVIEIVAARILAPSIGVSLYTWTSIIGIVLAGISIGNYLGGRVADRFPSSSTIGFILLGGGIFSLAVLPLAKITPEATQYLPLIPQIIFLATALFFIPSLFLGMVTPVVIKLRLQNLARAGSAVGKIYAVSTAGSIVGTFVTGFLLVQLMGTRIVILTVAILLVLMALLFGNLWRMKRLAVTGLVILICLGGITIPTQAIKSGLVKESMYSSIEVVDKIVDGRPIKVLVLDSMVHSFVSPEDPTFIYYDYEKVSADLAAYTAKQDSSFRALFIGGGGYTMPRYLEAKYVGSTLEVIEIDPEVTRVAFDYLGLRPDTHIITYNEDARMAVKKLPVGQYDIIFGDAFNNYSVPYQLCTDEFNQQINALLTSNGIYVTNIIDKLHSGRFLRDYAYTAQRTFPYVYLIPGASNWENDDRQTNIVICSRQPLTSAALDEFSAQAGKYNTILTPQDTMTAWFNEQPTVLLTDDFVPVDNMLAGLYIEQAQFKQAEHHGNTGEAFIQKQKWTEAIGEFEQVIRLDPNDARAYNYLGLAYYQLKQFQQAVKYYNEAINLMGENPGVGAVYCDRGNAYIGLGQFQSAVKDYNEALRLQPQFAEAYAGRALAYTYMNNDALAQDDLARAASLGYNTTSLSSEIEKLKKARKP